jgi:2-methylisocitrate lyase-like PEP mutase family enzyme
MAGHPGVRLRQAIASGEAVPLIGVYDSFSASIAGGKSPSATLSELRAAGVSLVNYSTPCLFAAQTAIDASMQALLAADGRLPDAAPGLVDVKACSQLLHQNLAGLSLPGG